VIDDGGLALLATTERHDLLEVLENRAERAPTLITSQLPVKAGHDVIGEPTLADAICDRLIHTAHVIKLHGPSMREVRAKAQRSDRAATDSAAAAAPKPSAPRPGPSLWLAWDFPLLFGHPPTGVPFLNRLFMPVAELARAVAHKTKAGDVLYRLAEFARGRPDSRPDSGLRSHDVLKLLSDEQLKIVGGWLDVAEGEADRGRRAEA
jgi:hypothetical protein